MLFVLELPALTFPKARLVGLAETETEEGAPLPLKEIVAGEFGAVLETVMVPARLPAVVGANTALTVVLPPGASIVGPLKPVTLYAAPLTVSWEIARDALPLLESVKVCDCVCPSTTLP